MRGATWCNTNSGQPASTFPTTKQDGRVPYTARKVRAHLYQQYRGLKIVYNCYESSYEELLTRANLPTLHIGRLRTIALETYKCINNSAPKYIRDLVNLKQSSYSFRYENTLQIPTIRTVAYGQKSFRFEAARVWNSLPNELRKVSAFKDFERLIRTWTGPKCNCAVCHS